jgi:hypothetical protein
VIATDVRELRAWAWAWVWPWRRLVEGDLEEDIMGVPARSERCKARLLEIDGRFAMIKHSAVMDPNFLSLRFAGWPDHWGRGLQVGGELEKIEAYPCPCPQSGS